MTKNDHQKPEVLSDELNGWREDGGQPISPFNLWFTPGVFDIELEVEPFAIRENAVRQDMIAKLFEKITTECTVEKSAAEFWRRIICAVGEKKARAIMDRVMSREKPGASPNYALNNLIMRYIQSLGLDMTDGKIAKRIHESKPYHVRCNSGASGVASKEIDEGKITHGRDEVIEREPINIKLIALKKQVERVRRQMLDAGDLPEAWRPRSYAPGS